MKKRKMPPHIVLPNGQWRFVKRGGGSPAKKGRNNVMARTRTRYRTRVVRGARRRYNNGGGWKSMLAPVLGGAADSILDPRLPINGIGGAAVGFFMNNKTVRDIGLYKVGYSLPAMIPGLGGMLGSGNGGSEGVL